MRIGAIEAGGTKFICGIGNEHGQIEEKISFPTEQPEQTLAAVIGYFRERRIDAIGIGCFGPINVDLTSSKYGYITTTPKKGWSEFPFVKKLASEFQVPFGWDTDVNAAALGEATWGAAKGLDNCIYYTVGTGIGMGVYSEGKLVHGLVHPEGGHMVTRRHPEDSFNGNCPFHGDCLEGMASGPAIERRWNARGDQLAQEHDAWRLEAYYIAQGVTNAILMLSPQIVILGGGVMKQHHLFPMIRTYVQEYLNGYVAAEAISEHMDDFIVAPLLGDQAGLCGAVALGIHALAKSQ